MAHLVRPIIIRYTTPDGKRCPKGTPGAVKTTERAKLYYGCAIPGLSPRKRVPLSPHKKVAQRLLDRLVERAERGRAGLPDLGQAKRPLAEHLDDFAAHLRAGGPSGR